MLRRLDLRGPLPVDGPVDAALLGALLPRVERFELREAKPKLNNVLHGLGTCVVDVVRA